MSHGAPDYTGAKSGVISQAEWMAMNAFGKTLLGQAAGEGFGGSAVVSYTVPPGKVLVIYLVSGSCTPNLAADGDKTSPCVVYVTTLAPISTPITAGGNCGAVIPCNPPIIVNAGTTIVFIIYNESNHDCDMAITANGYLE